MKKTIGIIMTYNCASMVEDIYSRLPRNVFDTVIIVDDGSKDNIKEVAEKIGIPFFIHGHLGYGGNLKYGLKKALDMGGDHMVEIHGDGQFGTGAIIPGLEKMKQGYDFVLGSRFTDLKQPLKDGMSPARYLANIGLSFFDRLILQLPLTEFHNGFRIYSRRLITTANFANTSNDYLFSFEIFALAKYFNLRVGEVPLRADYKKSHTSISMGKATVYSFQTFWVLFKYILARLGVKIKLFSPPSPNN